MRDYAKEFSCRVEFIKDALKKSGAKGIVFGNSGGKDSLLVGILSKSACDNTLGVIMPCGSKRNYQIDKTDAETFADKYGIETRVVDLTETRNILIKELEKVTTLTSAAISNIAPRLRMTTLYSIAASESRIVAGTGNRSEGYMGYFTKWGDGAYDFNPISDLTVTEIYEFLRFLGAPENIFEKPPSAGLFDGQTDEEEMGVSYKSIDNYLLCREVNEKDREIIDRYHKQSEHKRRMPLVYNSGE